MTNEVIFWTQIATILCFIVTLFVLYRVLVGTKDATIELLKEKISNLEEQLLDAKAARPDALLEKYSKRVKLLTEEIERLSKDRDQNEAVIQKREKQLLETKEGLSQLKKIIERARELLSELSCPYCKAPLLIREYHSEPVRYGGRELDDEHEIVEYECGLRFEDGEETHPCSGTGSNIDLDIS